MFTNNYLQYRKMMFYGGSGYTMQVVDGTNYTMYPSYSYRGDLGLAMHNGYASTMSNPGTYFGSGTTPPTRADYKLEAPITAGLSVTSGSQALVDHGNGKYEISCGFILRNTNAADGESITVAEIGYFGLSGVSSSKSYYVLMERQVLAVPLVIAPGESKLLTYKLTINQIFNVD